MNKGMVIVSVAVLITLVGCAGMQQAKEDYDLGRATPLAEGELSPREAATNLVNPIVPFIPLPFQPAAGVLITVLAAIGTWRRGRNIRKSKPATVNPITGNLGAKIGIESIVQTLANVATGVFQVGPQGSGLKRAWKTALVVVAALATGAVTIPGVKEFIIANPDIAGGITGLAALFAGLEKKLQTVMPTTPTP